MFSSSWIRIDKIYNELKDGNKNSQVKYVRCLVKNTIQKLKVFNKENLEENNYQSESFSNK